MAHKKGRNKIPDEEKMISAGVWVKQKNLEMLQPILRKVAKKLESINFDKGDLISGTLTISLGE